MNTTNTTKYTDDLLKEIIRRINQSELKKKNELQKLVFDDCSLGNSDISMVLVRGRHITSYIL